MGSEQVGGWGHVPRRRQEPGADASSVPPAPAPQPSPPDDPREAWQHEPGLWGAWPEGDSTESNATWGDHMHSPAPELPVVHYPTPPSDQPDPRLGPPPAASQGPPSRPPTSGITPPGGATHPGETDRYPTHMPPAARAPGAPPSAQQYMTQALTQPYGQPPPTDPAGYTPYPEHDSGHHYAVPTPQQAGYRPAPSAPQPTLERGDELVYERPEPSWNWRRTLTMASAVLLVLWVTALWAGGGGLRNLTTPVSMLKTAGRLSGLWASALMLVQMMLMARIPLIERSIGQPRLIDLHRRIGTWSFTFLLVHIAALWLGYAALDVGKLWPVATATITDAPGMVLALGGTVCIVTVMVTSMKRMRAWLRYETWHLLHLYAYLGTYLAVPHQLWTGKDFMNSPNASAFWWTLWGVAAICALVYRGLLPLVMSLQSRLTVAHVDVERNGKTPIVHVTVRGKGVRDLGPLPGQYFTWRFLSGAGWTRGHPFSLSVAPTSDSLRISAAVVGDGTREMIHLKPGTKVWVEGPYGRLHTGVNTQRQVALIGAGIGIAPLVSILDGLPGDSEVTVIYRVHSIDEAPMLEEIEAMVDERGATLHLLEGERLRTRASWLPATWGEYTDAEAMKLLVPSTSHHDVYVCGGRPWAECVTAALRINGVPAQQIFTESFGL